MTATIDISREQLEQLKQRYAGRYAVILHNDDHNNILYVIQSLAKAVPGLQNIGTIVMTAHHEGKAVVIVCGKEEAELYQERILSFGLTATIEPEQ